MLIKEKIKSYYIGLAEDKGKGALDALFSFFLLLASFIYGIVLRLALFCYRAGILKTSRAKCRVISVGNITWGGTGKTPFVAAVAEFLQQKGRRPAVLIRGYGKDEVYMLKDKFEHIPVLAGRDRVKTARDVLARYRVDTIILDDAFQHWRLERDVDIVLVDATLPFGNRRLIPRGILREPLSSLSRADILILTRRDLAGENIERIKKELRRYNPQAPLFEAEHSPSHLCRLRSSEKIKEELSSIAGRPVAVVCGIANPQAFEKTLTNLGAKAVLRFCFSDHYRYGKDDLERIEEQCLRNKISTVVTTEKDAAKLNTLLQSAELKTAWLALCVKLKIRDEEKFFRCLLSDDEKPYSVLILSDGKAGHLNQSRAVAGVIQQMRSRQDKRGRRVTVKTVEVKFKNGLFRILLRVCAVFSVPGCRKCLKCLRFSLRRDSFEQLTGTEADVIISAGASLSAVNLFLSYKNNARNVNLMKPSLPGKSRFDLVIVPEHDGLRAGDNVVVTRLAPNLVNQEYLKEQAGILKNNLQLKQPVIGVLIGGDTPAYRIDNGLIEKIVSQLKITARNLDCQMLVTTSRRTSAAAEKALKEGLRGR
jgi:tetraacyldisaccharide 4'-kinase